MRKTTALLITLLLMFGFIPLSVMAAGVPGNTASPFIQKSNLLEEQVIALVNQERAARNLGNVTSDPNLTLAAQTRAQEIIGTFLHTRPDQRSFSTMLSDAGISYCSAGENIAAGQANAEAVVSGWMNSEGHRANILNPEFTKLGVGYTYVDSEYGHYWAQLFISN